MTASRSANAIEQRRVQLSRRLVIFGALGVMAGLVLLVLGLIRGAPGAAIVGGILVAMQAGVIVVGLVVVGPRREP